MEFIGPILSIISDTLFLIKEKQRTKYMKKFESLLKEYYRMENLNDDEIIDSEFDNLRMELLIFIEAYSSELKKSNTKNLS